MGCHHSTSRVELLICVKLPLAESDEASPAFMRSWVLLVGATP